MASGYAVAGQASATLDSDGFIVSSMAGADGGSGGGGDADTAGGQPHESVLLASCECTCSLEINSQTEWEEVPARLYLLSTHLCIERPLLPIPIPGLDTLLCERKSFALTTVFGLIDRREGTSGGDANAAAGGGEGTASEASDGVSAGGSPGGSREAFGLPIRRTKSEDKNRGVFFHAAFDVDTRGP